MKRPIVLDALIIESVTPFYQRPYGVSGPVDLDRVSVLAVAKHARHSFRRAHLFSV